MIKVLILSLFTFLSVSLTSGDLFAGNLFLTHDQYIQLSADEQRTYVKSIMEFVVELEGQYKKDVSQKNIPNEKLRTTSQLILNLKSFFIEDAHAARTDWNDFASRFLSTLSGAKDNSLCIFAGWPSSMQNNLCRHPSTTSKMSEYQNTCGVGQVSCSPLIFGYKKIASKSLFCAPTDDQAKNSALECMKQALKDPADPDADSKDTRLNFLKDKLAANPAIINQIYKFTYQTCLCDKSPVAMDSSYAERIRPHRTCYGLMNMMANISTVCTAESFSSINTTIFSELKSKVQLDYGTETGKFDQLYESFRSSVRRSHPNDVKAMCPKDNDLALTTGETRTGGTTPTPPDDSGDIVVTAIKCTATCTTTTTTPPAKTCIFKRGEQAVNAIGTPIFGTGDKVNEVSIKINRTSTVAPADKDPNDPEPTTTDIICAIAPTSPVTPTPETSSGKTLKIETTGKTSETTVELKAIVKDSDEKEITDAVINWYRKDTKTTTATTTEPDLAAKSSAPGEVTSSTTSTTTTSTTPISNPPTLPSRGKSDKTGDDISPTRETTDYQLCAVATKTGYTDSPESCQKVEALNPADAAKNNKANGGSGLANPMMPPMGGGLNSTINGGIR
jgi:hypothetical protein